MARFLSGSCCGIDVNGSDLMTSLTNVNFITPDGNHFLTAVNGGGIGPIALNGLATSSSTTISARRAASDGAARSMHGNDSVSETHVIVIGVWITRS